MPTVADVRQALQAGLWEALVDDDDRAAMRATCRDARDMADELHDSAVLPVGPDTWDSAAAIAAYHRKLGAVQSLHVWYSCGEADDARAAQFVEAYSAALGAALPADSCTITMTADMQLSLSFAAVLLARVVPRVERLEIALGSYDNLAQLLTLLGPCTHLRSLRLLADVGENPEYEFDVHDWVWIYDDRITHSADASDDRRARIVLDALCGLTRLHTLSGPWIMRWCALRRLCAALPSLTTLGFYQLDLSCASGACISRQLHTLACWRHGACGDALSQPPTPPVHLLDISASHILTVRTLQSSLPAVQHLESLVLDITAESHRQELPATAAAGQRFAACAGRWAWRVAAYNFDRLQVPKDTLGPIQHMMVDCVWLDPTMFAADFVRDLIAVAPNITMLAVRCDPDEHPPAALAHMLGPLCRAARLHTVCLKGFMHADQHQTALLLAEAVRGLVRPNAEGECCPALRQVLLAGAQPDALHAFRLALADGGVDVSVDAWPRV